MLNSSLRILTAMTCTYLFLDEAGDFNFSPSGTKHFVLSSIAMRRPFPVLSEIDHYKHDCLEYGLPTEYFHCSEDNPHVRGRIFDIIARRLSDIKVDSLVVAKKKDRASAQSGRGLLSKDAGLFDQTRVELRGGAARGTQCQPGLDQGGAEGRRRGDCLSSAGGERGGADTPLHAAAAALSIARWSQLIK